MLTFAQACYFTAGLDAANQNSTSFDLAKHPTSRTSSTTSSQFDIAVALDVIREEPDFFDATVDVFADQDQTLTPGTSRDIQPPPRKMPRLSSIEDIFADTPPVPTEGILTKFYGHYVPGVSPPQTVRLQILDILECTEDGFLSNAAFPSYYSSVIIEFRSHTL